MFFFYRTCKPAGKETMAPHRTRFLYEAADKKDTDGYEEYLT